MWWSFVLAGLSLLGNLLIGNGRIEGWGVGVGAQDLWVVYALATAQYGFLLSAVVFAGVNIRNFLSWKRKGIGYGVGRHLDH